jgi:hypothetical protein
MLINDVSNIILAVSSFVTTQCIRIPKLTMALGEAKR